VYAATATFYECITGSKPYSGSTMFELAVQHAEAPIPSEQVPEPVRPLIRRGLAKTPLERPQSAAEFVAELQAVASAAYGEDWEERGQRKLAALVALLPLLLPSGEGDASGSTALAHTRLGEGPGGFAEGGAMAGALPRYGTARRLRLGQRGRLLVGAVAAVLISAGLALTAVATVGGDGPAVGSAATTPTALTSLTSGPAFAPATGSPTGDTPSASPSPSATPSASLAGIPTTATPITTASGATFSPTPTPTSGAPATTAPTTAPPTTMSVPPQPLHVISVSIPRFTCSGSGSYTALGTVTVQSDGAADGTLTLSWFHGIAKGTRGSVTVAAESVPLTKGQQSFSGTYSHYFGSDTYPYWGLAVSTNPAADSGNGSYQVVAACGPTIF
jgi:serine/threonine-protein kinase